MTTSKVLIVDDIPGNVRLLKATLAGDYQIYEADGGEGALEAVRADPSIDLILLDIMMPGIDGYEVCRRLKADKPTRHIPIIFVTAKDDDINETKGFELGAVDYIRKPINPSVVRARVRTQIQLHRTQKKLVKSKSFLNDILNTVADPIFVKDASYNWTTLNQAFCNLMGQPREKLIGKSEYDFLTPEEAAGFRQRDSHVYSAALGSVDDSEERLLDASGKIHTLATKRTLFKNPHTGKKSLVGVIRDVSHVKQQLARQEINIGLARNIMGLINASVPRYIDLGDDTHLFVDGFSTPCYAEGGDHFFIRSIQPAGETGPTKTHLSLKDQSGHEVGCVLRSIVTDLIHNAILTHNPRLSLEEAIARLNAEICGFKFFRDDEFVTSINVEIDHETLMLRYVSTGHPPFILIRDDHVHLLPANGGEGANLPIALMAEAAFSAGQYRLRAGDKLIFYTDGLPEMSQNRLNKTVSLQEFETLVQQVVACRPGAPVSAIAAALLARIAALSGEKVVPHGSNTSADDVSMISLEIEDGADFTETCLYPQDVNHMSKLVIDLCARLAKEWQAQGFKAPDSRLRLVIEEAVSNAWRHGNRLDGDKQIRVRWRCGNDFHLEVQDQGRGFANAEVADPTQAANLMQSSGRGIYIIQHLADSVCWRNGGCTLSVSFRPECRSEREKTAGLRKDPVSIWESAYQYPSQASSRAG